MSCGQWAVFTKLGGGAIRFASQPSQFIEQGSLTNEPNELPVFPILALSSSSSSSSSPSPSSSFPGIFPSDKISPRCFVQWWGWGLDGSFHNHHKLVFFYIHVQLGKVDDNRKSRKFFFCNYDWSIYLFHCALQDMEPGGKEGQLFNVQGRKMWQPVHLYKEEGGGVGIG